MDVNENKRDYPTLHLDINHTIGTLLIVPVLHFTVTITVKNNM